MTTEKQKKEIFEAPPLSELRKRKATFCNLFDDAFLNLLRNHLESLVNDHFKENIPDNPVAEYYALQRVNAMFPFDWSQAVDKLFHKANKEAYAQLCNPIDESETRVGDDGSRKCKFKTGCGNYKGAFRWFVTQADNNRKRECVRQLRAEAMEDFGPLELEEIELRYSFM